MPDPDLLLLPMFHELRRQGLPLGVGEYLLAVETLAAEPRPYDSDLLWWLCRLLWAKSAAEQQIFDEVFRRHIDVPTAAAPGATQAPTTPAPKLPSPRPDDQRQDPSARDATGDDSLHPDAGARNQTPGYAPVTDWIQKPAQWQPLAGPARYQFTPRLPIGPREMSGIWRHLRRLQREGPAEDLDVEGTIDRISRTGMLLGPVLQARRRNQVRLVLLVDRAEAMAAFAPVVEAIIESILRGGLLGQTATYYFQSVPRDVLFERPSLRGSRETAEVLAERAQESSVLFISDAGAAVGLYESARVEGVRRFLSTLRGYTYRYAWLNPVPKHRWPTTTAEAVAAMSPMYPLTREGLIDTVNILRGHPFPPGIG